MIVVTPVAAIALHDLEDRASRGFRRAKYGLELLTYQLGLTLAWSVIDVLMLWDEYHGAIDATKNRGVNSVVAWFEASVVLVVSGAIAVSPTPATHPCGRN